MKTLTRAQAHQLIDDIMQSLSTLDEDYSGLLELAQHWHRQHPESNTLGTAIAAANDDSDDMPPEELAQILREYVDAQCASDARDHSPKDDEDTGLTSPDADLPTLLPPTDLQHELPGGGK